MGLQQAGQPSFPLSGINEAYGFLYMKDLTDMLKSPDHHPGMLPAAQAVYLPAPVIQAHKDQISCLFAISAAEHKL
jgi:hypothetical protein